MTAIATRRFINEHGNEISIMVRSGTAGRDVNSRIAIHGPKSSSTNNLTRMEIEQLRDALNEVLAS